MPHEHSPDPQSLLHPRPARVAPDTTRLLPVDPFYFTMHRGAKHAADPLGVNLLFQIPKQWNVSVQVPILNAMIAKKPDAILIAPTDKVQLIAPLKAAVDQGIKVITVDTFIDDGMYQDGSGRGDFPLSYIASDNVLGGRMAARALAKSINGNLTSQLFLNFLNCKLFISSSIFSKPVSIFHMKNSIPSITATIVKILSTKDALAYCSPKIPSNGPANINAPTDNGTTTCLLYTSPSPRD